ncbi:hypothetical protein LX99_03552 [Mucilaginibacter oryzae]|uniref:Uncharacterized protein n=1 Tax=Mucilaginibacter oryzae TaxID=468058 RepID=A0A316H786_9SPHI|nr:hypothetical protein [Mucilaginibacter oryzae]PWK75821.1 hypothetical protein LX99_03552 [Mucilaginibacter oryzae]
MAIDGVKIIDSDLAHDTYWGFMDLYDSQIDFEFIEHQFPLREFDDFDEVDNEIYVTVCAHAYWETGMLTPEKLLLVKAVIEKGAGVALWAENSDKEGKARKRELENFWKKISQKNLKIRRPKTYRKITNLHFQPDTALAFQLANGSYRAIICIDVIQHRGRCNYAFARTTYNDSRKPTVADILEIDVIGRRMGTGYDQQKTREMQPGVEKVWSFEYEGGNCNYFFGIAQFIIEHKKLLLFTGKFQNIGSLKIISGLKMAGSTSVISCFEEMENEFADQEKNIKIFGEKKYPVKILYED